MNKKTHNHRFSYANAVWRMPDLYHSTKAVYNKLLDYCQNKWFCWPSIKTLAKELCYCRQTIITALKQCAEKKLINIIHRWDPENGGNMSNLYEILPLPEVDNPEAEPDSDQPEQKPAKKSELSKEEKVFLQDVRDEDKERLLKIFRKNRSEAKKEKDKIERINLLQGLYIN